MAVLIGLSLVDESLLLKTTLGGFPLIWYLSIATLVFATARTFTTTTSPFLVNGDSEEAMMQLSAETHYFPKDWRGRCESYDVRDEFLSLYPYKGVLLLQECLSVVLAPYILCVSLPRVAREILLFVRSHTLVLPQAGAVCRFAEFDFKEYGHDDKMERSFVNFKQNHPQWVGAQEGEALVQRLGQLKEEEMDKSMRMGDTMLYGSHLSMSMSQQLLQSQAIHTALGGGMMTPQDNEFYWLEKLQQRGRLADESKADSASISSLG
jgi:autophagy-related protein 9